MQVSLYDSKAFLPQDEGTHILVFAGPGSSTRCEEPDIVTNIHCTYRIGESIVEFLRNGDSSELRFEEALSWAVKYATTHSIPNVYAVFELNRPIDQIYISKICPNGFIDHRDRG